MFTGTTSYTVDVPRDLWDEYKEAKSADDNLNDALCTDIARRVLRERDGELDDETRALAEEMIRNGA